jgi:hypothetical protein
MVLRLTCLICVAAAAAVPTSSVADGGASSQASAHIAKRCGTISGGKYRVRARVVGCRFARKWSRAYLSSSAKPSGYACSRPGHGFALYCRKGLRQYWAEEL